MAVVSDGTTMVTNGWGNEWFWIVVLFLFGFGGFGGNGWGVRDSGSFTRAEMDDGFAMNQVHNNLRNIEKGVSDTGTNILTNMYAGFTNAESNASNRAAAQVDRLHALERELDNNSHGLSTAIAATHNAVDNVACGINRNIDALRYETTKQTCDIISAIKADGEATRALMTANTIQELRDNLQSAQLALHNNAQTQQILGAVLPTPRPCYQVMSPYQSYPGCGCGNA